MKVAYLNDYSATEYLGGAELSNKYWIEEGIKQGIEVIEITPDKIIPQVDYVVLANVTRFSPDTIDFLTKAYPYSIVTHGVPHISEDIYINANTACFMSPSHLLRNKDLNERGFYSAPYVNHNIFKVMPDIQKVDRFVYIGWLLAHKGIAKITDYAFNSKIKMDFYGKGDEAIKEELVRLGHTVYDEVKQGDLPAIYNMYPKFVWILGRYGSYGRTLVEALLCGEKLIIDSKNFGLFSYKWDFSSRDAIVENLEKEIKNFWVKLLN